MHRPLAAAVIAAGLAAAGPGVAETACADLRDLRLNDVNFLSSVVSPQTDDLPEHCSVRAMCAHR